MALAIGPTIKNQTIQNLDVFVWISNRFWQNGSQLFRFQMAGLLNLRSHSKSRPFANRPLFNHSKSRQVRISDPHCILFCEKILNLHDIPLNVLTLILVSSINDIGLLHKVYPPVSEASREVIQFNWKKKSAHPRIWCQRICLSVGCESG